MTRTKTKTLFVHAGIFKTGSSYLQSAIRHNKAFLARQGVIYAEGDDRNVTGFHAISAGNVMWPFIAPDQFERLCEPLLGHDGSVLLSSEQIFEGLAIHNLFDRFFDLSQRNGFERIKFLFFVRNPIRQAASRWAEALVREGMTTDLEEWLPSAPDIPRLAACLQELTARPLAEVSVINYSVRKHHLANDLLDWLELDSTEGFEDRSDERVNRTLTLAEQDLQLAVNRAAQEGFSGLGKALCQELPHLEGELAFPSREAQQSLWDRIGACVHAINTHLPPDQHVEFDLQPKTHVTSDVSFSREQLGVIASVLGQQFKRRRKPE
ncbi:MAG: hypothetical protein AAFY35_16125 [Pseudomonadota bacterium]